MSVVQKDQKRVALWRVENGVYKRLFEGTPSSASSTLAAVHAPSVGALTSTAMMSTATLTPSGDAFSGAEPPPKQSLGTVCHYDSECVSGHCMVADGTLAPPGGSLGGAPGGSLGGGSSGTGGSSLPTQTRKCVPADGTGETGDFCTQRSQCKSQDCSGTAPSKKCAAVSTPKKNNASSCTAPTECLSNTCTGGKCVPAAGTGPLGEYCNAPTQCASQTCTSNKCTTPPPTLYDAYGNTMCQRYCAVGTCDLCCIGWTTAETNLLVQGAMMCHAAASIWIWAQIACAIGEVSAFMAITTTSAWCVGSCSYAYPQPASANPMSCTLTK